MSWAVNLPQDVSKIRLSAGYIRGNNLAIQNVLSASSLTANLPLFPYTGSATPAPIWFYLDAHPPGWSLVAAGADTLLAVKGGGVYLTGGTQIGTWNGPAHQITLAELPTTIGTAIPGPGATVRPFFTPITLGAGHSHDWTTTRPQASVGILCTKDA